MLLKRLFHFSLVGMLLFSSFVHPLSLFAQEVEVGVEEIQTVQDDVDIQLDLIETPSQDEDIYINIQPTNDQFSEETSEEKADADSIDSMTDVTFSPRA
jgi:hypothetical protein